MLGSGEWGGRMFLVQDMEASQQYVAMLRGVVKELLELPSEEHHMLQLGL